MESFSNYRKQNFTKFAVKKSLDTKVKNFDDIMANLKKNEFFREFKWCNRKKYTMHEKIENVQIKS